jgi:hypothetical protein
VTDAPRLTAIDLDRIEATARALQSWTNINPRDVLALVAEVRALRAELQKCWEDYDNDV